MQENISIILDSLGEDVTENRPENLLTEQDLVMWLAARIADLLQHRAGGRKNDFDTVHRTLIR